MSILNYFRRSSELPDPNGELASKLPSTAMNKMVLEVQKRAQKRGKYNKYTPEVRAKIGRMASLIGPHSTAVRYTKLLHGEKCTREHCARNYEVVSRIVC